MSATKAWLCLVSLPLLASPFPTFSCAQSHSPVQSSCKPPQYCIPCLQTGGSCSQRLCSVSVRCPDVIYCSNEGIVLKKQSCVNNSMRYPMNNLYSDILSLSACLFNKKTNCHSWGHSLATLAKEPVTPESGTMKWICMSSWNIRSQGLSDTGGTRMASCREHATSSLSQQFSELLSIFSVLDHLPHEAAIDFCMKLGNLK